MAKLFDPKNYTPKAGNMKVGIHTGVKFESLKEEDGYLDITISGAEGSSRRRVFFPSNRPFGDETPQEALAASENKYATYLVGFLRLFIGDGVDNLPSYPTYEKMTAGIIAEIQKHKGKLLNVKVVPTKDLKYTEIPSYIGAFEAYTEGEVSGLTFSKEEEKRIALKEGSNNKEENSNLPF